MRTLANPSFFRLIAMLLSEADVGMRRTRWSHRGVEWRREWHTFSGARSGFAIDQYVITKSNPNGWSLLVVKEMWWDGDDKPIRTTQWAKPLSGPRPRMMEWLRAEERRIAARPLPAATIAQ